jgi:hypothetical protein
MRALAIRTNGPGRPLTSPADRARKSWSNGGGLSTIEETNLRRIADYWASLRSEGRLMPRRRGVDPLDIPWALSRFFLVDYERETETYRYRVAGDEVEQMFSRFTGQHTMRGVTLAEMLPAETAGVVHERWRPLADSGALIYMRGQVYLAAERIALGARILLPLSDREDGLTTGMIGYTEFEWVEKVRLQEDPDLEIIYIPVSETA